MLHPTTYLPDAPLRVCLTSRRQGIQWIQLSALSALVAERQIKHAIPERRDQQAQRAALPRRPLVFDPAIYARRNVVKRGINRLKQWHGRATRYEKRALTYCALLALASIALWLEG